MATFDNNLRLKEITTGDEAGTWGNSTNTNLELIADAFGYGTKELAADADETFTMPDSATDGVRSLFLEITSAVSLTATRTITFAPNTVSKFWIIKNSTTGGQSIEIAQGTGSTVTIANGDTKFVYTDGGGVGANVADAGDSLSFTSLSISGNATIGGTLGVTGATTLAGATATSLSVGGSPVVVETRNLVAGNGLTGGGTLAADRTFNVGAGTGISVGTNSVGLDTSNTRNVDHASVTFTAGNGLTGGGTLAADRTFNVGAGAGISVSANAVAIDSSWVESQAWSFTGNISIGGTLGVTGVSSFASGTATTPGIAFTGDTNTGILRPGADTLALSTGGSERVRIDDSGDVGIGTTSPAHKLDVQASSEIVALFSNDSTGGTGAIDLRGLGSNGTSAAVTKISAIPEGAGSAASFAFSTRNGAGSVSERMRITSSGDVGIGTSSPAQKLEVRSSEEIVALFSNDSTGETGTIDLRGLGSNGTSAAVTRISAIPEGAGAEASLAFLTRDGAGSVSERMRITSSGDVGIGTTDPGAPLEVSSGSNKMQFVPSARQFRVDGGSLTIDASSTGASLIFETENSERVRIDDSGNVGIGTTSPDDLLDVNGTARIENITTFGPGNRKVDLSFDNNYWRIRLGGATGPDGFRIDYFSNEIFRVDSNGDVEVHGDVGINTSSPAGKLDVDGTVYMRGLSGTTAAIADDADDGYLALINNQVSRVQRHDARIAQVSSSSDQTFADADVNTHQILTGSTDRTWTVPSGIGQDGGIILLTASGSATITIAGGSGVTITTASNLTTVSAGGTAVLIRFSSTEWFLAGDLE